MTVESTISWPHVRSLASCVIALLDLHQVLSDAVETVGRSGIHRDVIISAATTASETIRSTEAYPNLMSHQREMINDAWMLLNRMVDEFRAQCQTRQSEFLGGEVADIILVLQTLLAQARRELDSVERFLGDEVRRLEGRATHLASRFDRLCMQIRGDSAVPASSALPDNAPLYAGFDLDERVRLFLRQRVPPGLATALTPLESPDPARAGPRAFDATYRPLETYGEETFTFGPPQGNEYLPVGINGFGFTPLASALAEPNCAGVVFRNAVVQPAIGSSPDPPTPSLKGRGGRQRPFLLPFPLGRGLGGRFFA